MVVYTAVFGKGRAICLGVLSLRRNCRVRRAPRRRFGCNVVDQTHTTCGRIIDSLDCIEQALREKHLTSIAFDVLPDEPPKEHSLITAWRNEEPWIAGRAIITPHAAYYSEQGWYEMRYKAAETAKILLLEGKLRNQITE